MISTKEITEYLNQNHRHRKPFSEIASNHPGIESSLEAFDYDAIKRELAGDKCSSADALYLKKHIYFVGKETRNGKKLFYDGVDVWYDFEFDGKAGKLA